MELKVVRDIVVREFESAGENEPVLEAERRMGARGLGAMPIRGADGRVNAILTRADLAQFRIDGFDLAKLSLGDVGRPVWPVDAGESLEAALELLQEQEAGRLPVVENGKELGLVTRADILGYLGAKRELGARASHLVTELSPNDEMYGESFWSYVSIGISALGCVRRAQAAAGKESFESILDLPCGHGRILRVLAAAYPEARLAACDLNEDGVRFCERVFGATPFLSSVDPEEIELEGQFDLIWCGSLLTHLSADRWGPFLRRFESVLAPSGLLVLTVLGEAAAGRLREDALFGSPNEPDRVRRILEGYEETGFGYSDYEGQPGYGLSLSTPDRVRALIERESRLGVLLYEEGAWVRIQDAVACKCTG